MKGGKSRAIEEPEKAPINEINKARCGMSSATAPKTKN